MSSFSCTEGQSGPGIASCNDQAGHGSGSQIDTSSTGSHSFTVTATSSDGLTSTSTVTYKVAAPPAIWLPIPADGATYTQNQVVDSFFECADGTGGPGLSSCADQNRQAAGAPIDTSTLGAHSYTVTATSQDGQSTSATARYTVVAPPTVSNVKARHGVVTFDVSLTAPGAVAALETDSFRAFGLAADSVIGPPRGSFTFGRTQVVAAGGGKVHVTVLPSPAGKLLLRDHRRATIALTVYYTGNGGLPQTVSGTTLHIVR